MTDIIWQDPPPAVSGRGGSDFRRQFLDTLRESPGQWAIYPCSSKSASALAALFRKDGLEAVSRKVDGQVKVFVRVPA